MDECETFDGRRLKLILICSFQRHPSGHHRYPPGPRSIPPPRGGSADESFAPVSRSNASRSHHAQPQPHGSRSSHSNRNADPRRQYQSSSGGSRPSSGSRSTSAAHHGYDDGRGQQQNSYTAVQYKPIPDNNARIIGWQKSPSPS